jgi:nucleoside-diphosphate-sugar epimerase
MKLRTGEAGRIVAPGHVLNRAHVDDIAEFTRLVLTRGPKGQIWNVADEEPAPSGDVVAYAADLLGAAPPAEDDREAPLSQRAERFFAENRRISIMKAKALLGFKPAYPTYREGLRALAAAGEGRVL